MDKTIAAHTFTKGLRLIFTAVLLAALALSLTPVMVVQAAPTEVVTNTNDSGTGSLRQAIADVDPGGTITFSVTGAITLTAGELTIDKDLTITGPGADSLTISGNNNSRVFNIVGTVVTISGVTIANGLADSGAGIYNSAGTLTLNNSIVRDNSTGSGTSDTIGGNGGAGGGIYNAGTLTINNSTIRDNSTGNGGTGSTGGGDGGDGGGIYNASTLTISNSTISGNSTGNGASGMGGGYGGDGGGIYNSATLTITNSTIRDNSTGNGGGGMSGADGGSGGGIYNSGTLTINNSTINGNNTGSGASGMGGGYGGDGGGIYNSATLTITNSTVPDGAEGPDCYSPVSYPLTSYGYNLIENTANCTIVGDTTGNIYGLDPMLDPLADNGGPTQTHALQTGSPAIDAVIDCTTVDGAPVNFDQRGEPRPADGDNDGIAYCDIGAYEVQPPPEAVAVGGIVAPVSKIQLLAPWLGLVMLLVAAGALLVIRQRQAN